MRSLHTLWDGDSSPLGRSMKSTFDALRRFQVGQGQPDEPANGAEYPGNDLGRALAEVARVISRDVGVEVITVDQGDWDMHTDLGTVGGGLLVQNADDLAGSLAAFFTDLGPLADKVTLVTISEFGRRVAENASDGPRPRLRQRDVPGRRRREGRHLLRQLARASATTLDADLLVTTDYRSVLSEVVVEPVRRQHQPPSSPASSAGAVGVMAGRGAWDSHRPPATVAGSAPATRGGAAVSGLGAVGGVTGGLSSSRSSVRVVVRQARRLDQARGHRDHVGGSTPAVRHVSHAVSSSGGTSPVGPVVGRGWSVSRWGRPWESPWRSGWAWPWGPGR